MSLILGHGKAQVFPIKMLARVTGYQLTCVSFSESVQHCFGKVKRMARILGLVALLCFIAPPALGQGSSPPQADSSQSPGPAPLKLIPRSHEERERRYRDQHRIVLNVLAVDALNHPATGLKAVDFSLMDNGQPQALASFRAVTGGHSVAPPRVLLILDGVNNTARSINYEIREIGKYLSSNQGRLPYPTSIAVLTTSGLRVSGASGDGSELLL